MSATAVKERRDVATVMGVGVLAFAVTVYAGIQRALQTFGSPRGIAWNLAVDETPARVEVGSGTGAVDVVVRDGLVYSSDVAPVSVAMIVVSLVASVLTAFVVIACVLYLARCALRGDVFSSGTVRVWDVVGWALVGGGALMLFGDTLGGNGVLAAVGLQDADVEPSVGFWGFAPMWAIAVACGLMGIAFRRGLRMQKDTEGLV